MVIALVQAQHISTCKTLTVLVEATHNLMSSDLIIVMLLLVIFLVSATAAIAVVKASPASFEEDKLLAVNERSKLATRHFLCSFVQ